MELWVVGFEGEDVVGFTLDDEARNVFLAIEHLNGHDTAKMNSRLSSSGTAVISLDFLSNACTLRESHDHDMRLQGPVVRSVDECWRIHCAPVSDSDGLSLGWAVVAVFYPGRLA